MKIFFKITILLIIFIKSTSAYSVTWEKKENDECSIKTNHPELLASKPRCNTWSTNYQYVQTFYLKTNELIFFGKLQLAQPGYYWHNSGDIVKGLKQFNFIKDNVMFKKSNLSPVLSSNFWSRKPDNFDVYINDSKYKKIKCFGFWDGGGDTDSIGRRHNLYGMICNLKGNEINILKRKEFLNHVYINHKYVSTNPKPWSIKNNNTEVNKEIIKPNMSPLDKAKSNCTELGYKPKSEKHADCVLKLIDKN